MGAALSSRNNDNESGRNLTPGEALLARLCKGAFLGPWSIPSPHRTVRQKRKLECKELCDLLVIFGDDVLIFSEKSITFTSGEIGLSWARWKKRAIYKSCQQALGAERYLESGEANLFGDTRCKHPLHLTASKNSRFHKIVVAQGSIKANLKYFEGGNGTLMPGAFKKVEKSGLDSPFTTDAFALNDNNFFHIFDEKSLFLLLQNVNTALDFINYLKKRRLLFESFDGFMCKGEEGLVVHYMINMDPDNQHGFNRLIDQGKSENVNVMYYDEDNANQLLSNKQYAAKVELDKISYFWDNAIDFLWSQKDNSLSEEISFSDHEVENGLRIMASQSRVERRNLSRAFLDAREKGDGLHSYSRSVYHKDSDGVVRKAYVFIFLTNKDIPSGKNYEDYKMVRVKSAEARAYKLKEKFPDLETVCALLSEPPQDVREGRGESLDAITIKFSSDTPIDEAYKRELLELFNPFDEENTEFIEVREKEYPDEQTD